MKIGDAKVLVSLKSWLIKLKQTRQGSNWPHWEYFLGTPKQIHSVLHQPCGQGSNKNKSRLSKDRIDSMFIYYNSKTNLLEGSISGGVSRASRNLARKRSPRWKCLDHKITCFSRKCFCCDHPILHLVFAQSFGPVKISESYKVE